MRERTIEEEQRKVSESIKEDTGKHKEGTKSLWSAEVRRNYLIA